MPELRRPLVGRRRAGRHKDRVPNGTRERKQAAARYNSELFDPELVAAHAETVKDLEKARRIAHMFRFVCPSYYIPGKQEWGAF